MSRRPPIPEEVKARIIERFRSPNPPSVDQIVRETKLSDTVIYRLRKEAVLGEGSAVKAPGPAKSPEPKTTEAVLVKRIRELEAEVARKNALIADLSALVVTLQKTQT